MANPAPIRTSQSSSGSLIRLDIGLPDGKAVLEIAQVARALSMSESTVRNHIDSGEFVSCPKGTGRARQHVTIESFSVIAWKLNHLESQGVDVSHFEQSAMVRFWRAQLKSLGTRKGRR